MTPYQHPADEANLESDSAGRLLGELSHAIEGERKANRHLRSNCRDDCREQLKPLPSD